MQAVRSVRIEVCLYAIIDYYVTYAEEKPKRIYATYKLRHSFWILMFSRECVPLIIVGLLPKLKYPLSVGISVPAIVRAANGLP